MTGERNVLARASDATVAVVPRHGHDDEQPTDVFAGAPRSTLGADDTRAPVDGAWPRGAR